jgi:UDP:flavonoid glycosyltransferase YjiC (YdhE family)
MRVLMTTTGHAGHVLPLAPVARALVRAGHEVRMAGPGDRGAVIQRAGVPFHPLADAPEEESWPIYESTLGLSHDEANIVVIGEIFGRIYKRAALPGLLDAIDSWRPHLIVRETYEFASVVAAERHGIPHVRVGTGLAAMEDWGLELAAAASEDLDAEAIRSSPYLTQTPLSLEDPEVPDQPDTLRFRSGEGAARLALRDGEGAARSLPEWWPSPEGDPLVYLSFGSVAGALPFYPALYRAAIDALADLDARVLVTIGDAGDPAELGALPPGVSVERWVPQEQVMPRAAAVIGHGGYGSTLAALTAGVPMVVVPLFADQPYNARRVAGLGAGVALPAFPGIGAAIEEGPGAMTPLGEAVRRVLDDPAYRLAAERVAAETAALPSAEAMVSVLEAVACHHPWWCSAADPSNLRGFSGSGSASTSAGSLSSSSSSTG